MGFHNIMVRIKGLPSTAQIKDPNIKRALDSIIEVIKEIQNKIDELNNSKKNK